MYYPDRNGDPTPPSYAEFDDSADDGEGKWVEDEFYSATPVPLTKISSVLHPVNSNQAWFFCANHYAFVEGFEAQSTLAQTTTIVATWPSLSRAGFACYVDAVLPNPDNKQEMYFFSRNQYAYIDTMPGAHKRDHILKGPLEIIDGWASLKSVEFTLIDAILENPANKEEAWFFSGEKYVCVSWRPGKNDDVVVDGPKAIIDGWVSLKKAGFKTVDSILPNPTNLQEAWVLSGKQYARINVIADTIVSGPQRVSANWPSLHEAYFY